jgi:hypothetical protein
MWNKIDELKYASINIEAYKSENSIIDEKYDLAILFNSYDSRSLEYVNLFKEASFKNSIIISFQSDKKQKAENLIQHRKNMDRLSEKSPIIIQDIDIFEYQTNISIILQKLPLEALQINSKWFMDISGVPIIYTISLLKIIKRAFPSPVLHCVNFSGEYISDVPSHNQFSEGYNRDIYIPNYAGSPDFSKPWKYIFILGWEGTRSLSVLKKCEPDSVEIIITKPGYKEGYEVEVVKNNRPFLLDCGVPESHYIYVDAGNPVQIVREIETIFMRSKDVYNLCIVPLGVKPHGLGAGIYGCLNNDVSVMYQVPKKYKLHEVKRGKYVWLYIIK